MAGLQKFLEWWSKDRRRIPILFASCCLVACTVSIAGAAAVPAAPARWSLQDLMQALATIKSDSPQFVQRQYLLDLAKPLVTSGVLIYKAPDYLEQRTEFPSHQRAIIRGDSVTLYSASWQGPRIHSLQEAPGILAVVESLRATLAGQLPVLRRYFTVHMNGSSGKWQLELNPRAQMKEHVVSVLINGRAARIDRIEIHYIQGNYSIMRLHRTAQ